MVEYGLLGIQDVERLAGPDGLHEEELTVVFRFRFRNILQLLLENFSGVPVLGDLHDRDDPCVPQLRLSRTVVLVLFRRDLNINKN